MRINVKLFAGLVDLIGVREISVDVLTGCTVAEVKRRVCEMYPRAATEIARCLAAVNREYAADDVVLNKAPEEFALIPPVGGGSDDGDAELDSCRIVDHPLDVQSAFTHLEDVHCGGTVLFVGTVREWTKGRRTVSLTYEAYVDMALQQMRTIAAQVRTQHPGVRTLQWHRVGLLEPKDIAVICAAAAPHRDDAFAAARLLIERLKKEVPIWKQERYADGETVWQANP